MSRGGQQFSVVSNDGCPGDGDEGEEDDVLRRQEQQERREGKRHSVRASAGCHAGCTVRLHSASVEKAFGQGTFIVSSGEKCCSKCRQ